MVQEAGWKAPLRRARVCAAWLEANTGAKVVAKGKLVTPFRCNDPLGGEGYRNVYYWKGGHVVVYGISGNGYISTAFVSKKGKFM